MRTITDDDIARELYERASRVIPTHVGEWFMRFMGASEFYALIEGRDLENRRDHSRHANTNSRGFCFLPVTDVVRDVRNAYEFLSGIVDEYVAVVFVNESAHIEAGWGEYADPYDDYGTMFVEEFFTSAYDRESMVPIFACFGPFNGPRYDVMHVVEI